MRDKNKNRPSKYHDKRIPKVLMPMIRRTFPQLTTAAIVGVQPMTGPIGLAFAMKYSYGGVNLKGATPNYDEIQKWKKRKYKRPEI